MLYVHEHEFDQVVVAAAARYSVPAALVLAVIAQESAFQATAVRAEPQLGDASRGLMQLLLATARGLGFTGTPDALADPAVNIPLGVHYLAQQWQRTGEWAAAVSAYNGGYRPTLAFGKRALAPVTVCVARDGAGTCIRTRVVPIGEFANQDYVDNVLGLWEHYKTDPPEGAADGPVEPGLLGTGGCLFAGLAWLGALAIGRAV